MLRVEIIHNSYIIDVQKSRALETQSFSIHQVGKRLRAVVRHDYCQCHTYSWTI
jgi:hypothetical protein